MIVKETADFTVTGRGTAAPWARAVFYPLTRVGGHSELTADVAVLYSSTGLYGLFRCEAEQIYAPVHKDFADLYEQDVVEAFLQPDADIPVYLEYELSPLGAELPLMVVHRGAEFFGWLPFHYEGARKIAHGASITGGPPCHAALCTAWTAEFKIPFALLEGVLQSPPKAGDCWRGNFFRIEHDARGVSRFACAADYGEDFHRTEGFAKLDFVKSEA